MDGRKHVGARRQSQDESYYSKNNKSEDINYDVQMEADVEGSHENNDTYKPNNAVRNGNYGAP